MDESSGWPFVGKKLEKFETMLTLPKERKGSDEVGHFVLRNRHYEQCLLWSDRTRTVIVSMSGQNVEKETKTNSRHVPLIDILRGTGFGACIRVRLAASAGIGVAGVAGIAAGIARGGRSLRWLVGSLRFD